MKLSLKLSLFVVALLAFSCSGWAVSKDDIDGAFGSEWIGKFVQTMVGHNSQGKSNAADFYWDYDSDYVYGAWVNNTGINNDYVGFANAYVYSSSLVGGTYGDGNDVLVCGNSNDVYWQLAVNGNPWAITQGKADGSKGVLGKYTEAIGSTPSVLEFAISKSVLGDYSRYQIYGQPFGYGWAHEGKSIVVNAKSPQAVPEPMTLVGFGMPLLMVGISRIRSYRK